MSKDDLNVALSDIEEKFDGNFFIDLNNLKSGETFTRRESEVLPTSSVGKLFILCEMFRQANSSELDLEELLTYNKGFYRPGDGVLRAMLPGLNLSIYNLSVLMMIVSDNVATAMLVERLGVDNISRTMERLGLADSNFHQGLPSGEGVDDMIEPVSSPRDLQNLMSRIYHQEILTKKSCNEIIHIMRANRMNDMLGRHLNVGEDWGDSPYWIANKIGYGECRVEVGLVYTDSLVFSLGMFFCPNNPEQPLSKGMADYPPVLAMSTAIDALVQYF